MSAVLRETPDIETASDAHAQRLAGAAGGYLLAEQEAAIRAVLADWRGGTVLDVGGGHGRLTSFLQRRAREIVVLGSDACGGERARRGFASATRDLFHLPFAPRSFDAVVAVRLLPQVRNWPRLLSELCRVAQSTVVVDYPRASVIDHLTPLLFSPKEQQEGNVRHNRTFRDAEIAELLRACGFEAHKPRAQFLLPMLAHRRAAQLRGVERAAKLLGLTQAFGSQVVVRADRCPA